MSVGFETTIAAAASSDTPNALTRALEEATIPLIRVPVAHRRKPVKNVALESLRRSIDAADVVHAHGYFEALPQQALREAKGRVRVLSPHGMLTSWSLNRKRIKKSLYLRIIGRRHLAALNAIHFCSGAEEVSTFRLPRKVSRWTIPLPYETPKQHVDSGSQPGVNQPAGELVVVFVGRVVQGKGVDRLIQAFGELRHTTARLKIVGGTDNPYGRRCVELAESSNRSERIEFTGALQPEEVNAELRRSHLFVLPSAHENFGQAAVEAMACGLPCLLSSGVALVEEAGVDKATGAASRDPSVLASQIDGWLADAEGRRRLSEAAARWVKAHVSSEAVGRVWREHFLSVMRS